MEACMGCFGPREPGDRLCATCRWELRDLLHRITIQAKFLDEQTDTVLPDFLRDLLEDVKRAEDLADAAAPE